MNFIKSMVAIAVLTIAISASTRSNSKVIELLSNDIPSFTETLICQPSGQICSDGGCDSEDRDDCKLSYEFKTELSVSYYLGIGAAIGQSITVETSARKGGYACCYFTTNSSGYVTGLFAKCYDLRCCTNIQYY